jgi:hypothetical protein
MRTIVSKLAVLGAVVVGLQGCMDAPTGPTMEVGGEAASLAKGGNRPKAMMSQEIEVPMKTAIGETAGTLTGVVYLTRVDLVDGQLVGTARIIGTATTALGSQPVDVTTTAPLSINGRTGVAQTATAVAGAQDISAAAVGTCEVLNLVLGPLHLDLLGLVVDLDQVVLDIVAQTGAGNLVGNLLCAVVSLLDGVAIFPLLTQLLERLNDILSIF